MAFIRIVFTGVLCALLSVPVWADKGDEYRHGGQAVSHGLTGTGNKTGGGTNTVNNCSKVEHIGNNCTSNTGSGKCNCQRYEGKGSARRCVAVGCSVKQCNKGLNFYYNQFEDGKSCLYGASPRQANVEDEEYPLYKGIGVTICGSKGFCGRRPNCPDGQVAPKLKLSDGTVVFAGCYDVSTFTRVCPSGEIFENENSTKCVPCTACKSKNANCKLKGSNGVDQCYYETSCADGYEKEQNHDKYNPVCTEIPKPVVASEPEPAPEPAPEPCNLAVLNAMAATHDANGNCVATKCLDKYVLENAGKPDAKCVPCTPCDSTNAECKLTGSNGISQCTYDTKCSTGYEDIQNAGQYNVSCSKAEYAEIEEPEINVGPIESDDNVPDEKMTDVEFEEEQEEAEPTVYRIEFKLDGGSGCDTSQGMANESVSCTPTKDKFDFVGWCYDANHTNCTSGGTFTIKPDNDNTTKITMYAKWQEQKRTECSEDEKDKFPNATEFQFENGACKPVSCADKYELKDGKCVEQKRTECLDDEKANFPNATEFKFENDKCEPVSCANGYKLKNGECVDDGVKEAEDNYKKAKERENSLENRMLGGATMAATGIGGMQLAQGLAEQNADDAAARDMAAYMATFQCRIGDKGGKSYPGGTSNIETPGANQLINTYQEYVALAKDLSERKSALGMKAGIEAEVILDKSATGLYDDVGHGVMGGTYASLYRAAMGSETDKQKLDSDKEASSNRVKGGAIAAGGGAVGGAIGNMLINGGDDETATKKDCTQSGKVWENGKCQDVVVKDPTNKTSKRTDDTREPKVTSTANNSTQSSRTANQDNFNFDEDGINHWGYNLGGSCAHNPLDDGDRVALDADGTCARLTKKGTWWTSFSYGIIYGDSKCGAEDENSLVPCLCKITSVDDKKVNKSDWEKFTDMNGIEHCKRDCATQCGTYLSISKDLRKKSFTPIMKYLKK